MSFPVFSKFSSNKCWWRLRAYSFLGRRTRRRVGCDTNEDPYAHSAAFIEICNTVKIVGVPDEAIRLSLFSFSLAWEAKRWLHSFKGNSLKTWEEVVEKFLKKYFLESKTTEGKAAISSFHQFPDESLSEALERFRGLLRRTPTHGFLEPIQLNMFIDGLRPQTKQGEK